MKNLVNKITSFSEILPFATAGMLENEMLGKKIYRRAGGRKIHIFSKDGWVHSSLN